MTRRALFHYDPPKVAPKLASELTIQASCIMRVTGQFKARMVAVPNGTHIASAAGRGKANTEGRSKGFPDCIIVGYGPNSGKVAFAEIKARSALKPEQEAWLTALADGGHDCGVFRSQDSLAAWLAERGWR